MAKITVRQLEYFEALAHNLHFGRAAQTVGVSQPALSAQIAEMEAALGGPFFDRGGAGVRLSSRGERHRPAIEDILRKLRELEASALQGSQPLQGRFRLGVIPTVAPYLLPALLPALKQRFPEMEIELREAKTAALADQTIKGGLDAFICASDLREQRLNLEPLFEEDFLLAIPADEIETIVPPLPPQSTVLERLMLLEEGHCMRDQALAVCGQVEPVQMTSFGATSLTTLLQMVGAGMGVTLMPRMAEASLRGHPDVAVVGFAGEAPTRCICLASRRSDARADDFRQLAETVRETQQGLASAR